MANRKFLTSVADVFAYDENENVVFVSKTLLDSSIEVSLGSAPVRGGRGNQLQYIYYHTGEMKFTLTDTQWNLAFLGATVGADAATNVKAFKQEDVAVVAGAGTLDESSPVPQMMAGDTVVYGWATLGGNDAPAVAQAIVFGTGTKSFTGVKTAANADFTGTACIRYYAVESASTEIKIKANMIPKVVKLVMEAQLNSADSTQNRIGSVQIIAPAVTLSGAFTISMKSDGVSNTPLTATALAYNDPSDSAVCSSEPYYARLVEIIDGNNWYDNVIGLSIAGGSFAMQPSTTRTLSVWAIPLTGNAFKVDNSELTFDTIGSATNVTCNTTTGVVTAAAGFTTGNTGVFKAKITDVTTIDSGSITVSYTA